MKGEPRVLLRLLLPHARPYAGAFLLVLLLGWLTALATGGARLLLLPTWHALFPEADAQLVEPALPPEASAPEELPWWDLEQTFERWKEAGLEAVLGPVEARDEPSERLRPLLRVAGLLGLVALIGSLAQYGFTYVMRRTTLRVILGLRMALARHLMGLSMRYHGRRHFGDLLSRVSADVQATSHVLDLALRDLVLEPLVGLVALGGAFFVSVEATLIVVFGLPLLMVPIALLMRRVRKGSRKSLTQLGASIQALSQMFQGIRTVKAFRAEERELARFGEINERYLRATMRMVRAIALSRAWTILYSFTGMGVLLVIVGWLTTRGIIAQPGDMLVFFMMISTLYSSIKVTTRTLSRVEEAVGAAHRLQELLEERPDVVEAARPIQLEGLGAGIRFEEVSFSYPDGDGKAIDRLTLAVRPGETLALVGPSGAGKSTLLDLVARFIDPDEGRVTAGGVDLREVSFDSWSRQYAMVTQEPFLFHATIEENVAYGRPGATSAEVRAACRAANIADYVESLPEAYGTDVADAGTRLSGGQRQRITIARAILRGAPLLLLDEATSALDSESEVVVQEALERLMAGHTVIVIAHRLSTVRRADRIAVLDRGRLVELGTHAELLAKGGLYARLHASQFREAAEPQASARASGGA